MEHLDGQQLNEGHGFKLAAMNIESISRLEDVKPVFLYIPDISGFTKFINDTNLRESKKIVHALLESIVDSNILNLKIAEIPGDAIVFYSLGTPPNLTKLETQAKKTFLDFQRTKKHLSDKFNFVEQLNELSLKIIVHYGEVATTEIKGINKLIGSDLILAYKILKNTIHEREYLLMTRQYLDTQKKELFPQSFLWSDFIEGVDNYESFGEIYYHYVPLTPLASSVNIL